MGKFFLLDSDRLSEYDIPKRLIKYDRRFGTPWPNQLFPFSLGFDYWHCLSADTDMLVKLRRFVEQRCLGDVAVEIVDRGYVNQTQLWFEHENDMLLTQLTWNEWIVI